MTTFLIILQFILAIVITVAVLLQKSSSIGLGAYSGSNESLFGAKGPMGFLAKFTFIMGILFIINTLSIGYFYSQKSTASITDKFQSTLPKGEDKNSIVPAIVIPNAQKIESNATTKQSNEENKTIILNKTIEISDSNTTAEDLNSTK